MPPAAHAHPAPPLLRAPAERDQSRAGVCVAPAREEEWRWQRERAPLRLPWLPVVGLGSCVSGLGWRLWRLSRRKPEPLWE